MVKSPLGDDGRVARIGGTFVFLRGPVLSGLLPLLLDLDLALPRGPLADAGTARLDIQRALNSSLSIDRRIPVETREAADRGLRCMVIG